LPAPGIALLLPAFPHRAQLSLAFLRSLRRFAGRFHQRSKLRPRCRAGDDRRTTIKYNNGVAVLVEISSEFFNRWWLQGSSE
jgi:hypothetical protein